MNIQELIEKGLSQRQIAKEIGKSQGSVKHTLKKLGLKTKTKEKHFVKDGKKLCSLCEEIKSIDNFYRKWSINNVLSNVCKDCSNKQSLEQMINTKIKMIEYKGNKCENCSIQLKDSHYCIFDFHHKDPNKKDKNYKSIRGWSWNRIIKEIDDCKLLCANCHRLEHQKILS